MNWCVCKMHVPFYSALLNRLFRVYKMKTLRKQAKRKLPTLPSLRFKTTTNRLCSQSASNSQSSVCGPAQTCRCPRRPGHPAAEHRRGRCQVCCSKTMHCFLQYAGFMLTRWSSCMGWFIVHSWLLVQAAKMARKGKLVSYSSQFKIYYSVIANTTKSCIICLSLGFWWCRSDSRSQKYSQSPSLFRAYNTFFF